MPLIVVNAYNNEIPLLEDLPLELISFVSVLFINLLLIRIVLCINNIY